MDYEEKLKKLFIYKKANIIKLDDLRVFWISPIRIKYFEEVVEISFFYFNFFLLFLITII